MVVAVLSACTPTAREETTSASSTTVLRTTTTSATASTTTTTVPATTTTSTPRPTCRPDPFTAEFVAQVAADYPGKQITAHVHDLRTNCGYSLNRDNRQITASVFKVMVMAGTLLEAQEEGRDVTEREMAWLKPMITESANSPVRALWRSFGGSPWFSEQGEIFGLRETTVRGDDGSSWGGTRTSALDQVNLIRQVLVGEWGPLESGYRWIALDLMTSVVEEQTWGVTAGVPDGWTVAQKNGFAGSTINSVGWVDEPGPSKGYVVAILTRGWPSHVAGIASTERISETIAAVMTSS
jgi:beta-lactamase class A